MYSKPKLNKFIFQTFTEFNKTYKFKTKRCMLIVLSNKLNWAASDMNQNHELERVMDERSPGCLMVVSIDSDESV